jgi:hypothetical protein
MTSLSAPLTAPKIIGKAVYLELVVNPALTPDQQRTVCGWHGAASSTKQMIIFPQYQGDTGKIMQSVVMTRTVSEHSPRAQWDTSYTRGFAKLGEPDMGIVVGHHSDYTNVEHYSKEEFDELSIVKQVESRQRTLALTLKRELLGTAFGEVIKDEPESSVVQAWVVRDDTPLAVEITNEDMALLHDESKTPQAVIRRINKVRESVLTFPNKLA